jgi:hypothetical protein
MYIVKLAIADLADYYAKGDKSPELYFTQTLAQGPRKVDDVVAWRDHYVAYVETPNGGYDAVRLDGDASEWFVTTDKEVSELG